MQCIRCGAIMDKIGEGTYCCSECDHAVSDRVYRPSNCDIPMPQSFGEQKGWICPVCGRGVAPWTSFCPCQINRNIIWASGTGSGQLTYDECVKALEGYGKELKL